MQILENEGYKPKYDGHNITIGNRKENREKDLELFKNQILPYLISDNKRKEAKELIQGYLVRLEYKKILNIIANNPDITQKELSTKLNIKNTYRALRALLDAKYIEKEGKVGETFKYRTTILGIYWLKR
jgi:predicted HTH transcriptional regulator